MVRSGDARSRGIAKPCGLSSPKAFNPAEKQITISKAVSVWPSGTQRELRRDHVDVRFLRTSCGGVHCAALSSPLVFWLLDVDGKRYRMRCRTEGERNACIGIKPHGRPGVMNAIAAALSTGRKREERSKCDRGEYELEFAARAQQSKERRKCDQADCNQGTDSDSPSRRVRVPRYAGRRSGCKLAH
jgi:hypothetical protein